MDVKARWRISADVEALVEVILQCRKQLITECMRKHGMKTRLLSCDVYAGDKLIEMLSLSKRWRACMEMTEEDLRIPPSRRQKRTTTLLADFTDFKLHRMPVLGETDVRVLASFDVGDEADQAWYGNVELIA